MKDHEWLGLLLASESNQPHEWPFIGWVARNRVEAPGRFGATLREVILQPRQFSYFNGLPDSAHADDDVFHWALGGYPAARYDVATKCAEWVLSIPGEHRPFPANTYYFWSPVSMQPQGRMPAWAHTLVRFTPQGIDPWRFVFAHE